MPEGPESRIISEWLHRKYAKGVITLISYSRGSSLFRNGTYVNIDRYYPLLIEEISCRGKHIIWKCSSGDKIIYFHNHLGMSGRWSVTKGDHSYMSITIGTEVVYFDDTRRFGDFSICYTLDELTHKLKDVGFDLMDLSIKYYTSIMEGKEKSDYVSGLIAAQTKWINLYTKTGSSYRSRNKCVYVMLMEQKHFAGIGAYLAAEILYNCKISPERTINTLTKEEIILLFNTAIEIMYASYGYGGLTIKDFWNPEGKPGVYPRKIYGKEKDPNGYVVCKTKFSNGRSCQWVKEIQK